MNAATDIGRECPPATDGEIASRNLSSARLRCWNRFPRDPLHAGLAEAIVELENFASQFLGDTDALDRLETLAARISSDDPSSPRTALLLAQVASMGHRFAKARCHLDGAESAGASREAVRRIRLSVDQACGTNLEAVTEMRYADAASDRLEDLAPLGALLVDLRAFEAADTAYRAALRVYTDVSPFAPAWVCFQLGMLWGEQVPERDADRAAAWYRRAVSYVPAYPRARIHLAELLADDERTQEAEALLVPATATGDPEAAWRLSDVLVREGRLAEAEAHLTLARSGFERLLDRHLLAFADHGAEFYAGSGGNPARALELARLNVTNRPTLRAFEQAHAIAVQVDDIAAATALLGQARARWQHASFFHRSPLADTAAPR